MTSELEVSGEVLECEKGWEVKDSVVLEGRWGRVTVHVVWNTPFGLPYIRVFGWDGSSFGAHVSDLRARAILLSTPKEVIRHYAGEGGK